MMDVDNHAILQSRALQIVKTSSNRYQYHQFLARRQITCVLLQTFCQERINFATKSKPNGPFTTFSERLPSGCQNDLSQAVQRLRRSSLSVQRPLPSLRPLQRLLYVSVFLSINPPELSSSDRYHVSARKRTKVSPVPGPVPKTAAEEFGNKWLDWPAPRPNIKAAQEFIKDM